MSELYDKDFFCWTVENAALIREGRLNEADLEHVAEEIEDMGRSQRSAVRSRIRIIVGHMLKWQFQPTHRTKSWRTTINRERLNILDIFDDSPSLRLYAEQDLQMIYPRAVKFASDETGLPAEAFPKTCPYTFEQILGDYFPEVQNS